MSDLYAKQNWKDSDIYVFDQEILDYMLWGYVKDKSIAKQFARRAELQDPIALYFNQNIQKNLFEKMIKDNAVIPAQKLLLYYLLRKAQNEFPELFSALNEGFDYYVFKPEGDPQCYFLVKNNERFYGSDLQMLDKA